ncbi:sigma-70 family RNA polymerase sigma factor [Thauera sp. JM12B12]|uniref:RNA polymerase sigma factor n=1 Tax=Thauera sp. JM12B12 TaxID=3142262 RepID=UPI0031F3CC1F
MDSRAILAELPRLRRYARALVGSREAADDLVQDTLERAWSRVAQWQAGSDLRSWLLAIMHNLRIDQMRRPALAVSPLDEEAVEVPARATQTDLIELGELEAAVSCLPEEQRAVLLLVALEDMSYAQVAATLNIPAGTVMSRLARGRERLRGILDARSKPAQLRVVR